MEELKNIIRDNQMSTRPEYYSGRGATTSDLNHNILVGIHAGLKKEFGDKAAKAFVKMVDGIKVMSATTFLQELYRLYYNRWKYTPEKEDESGIHIPKDDNGDYDTQAGVFGVMEAMMGGNRHDDTMAIKLRFLMDNGVKMQRVTYVFGSNCETRYHPKYRGRKFIK